MLMKNGLYDTLVKKGWLVRHTEEALSLSMIPENAYKIIKPSVIPFISYPFEWCFSQYREAALLVLEICTLAIKHGMILKDASAYNVQFIGSKPVFIDTLSFEKYEEGRPWIAYGQFCRHFLSPILLMSHTDTRLSQLMHSYIDGIPLDLTAGLLPFSCRFNVSTYLHIYLYKKEEKKSNKKLDMQKKVLSKKALIEIINNLRHLIKKASVEKNNTEWAEYYENMHNYSDVAFSSKANILRDFLNIANAKKILDMGGNRGEFSKIAREVENSYVVCCDIDHTAVNKHFMALKSKKIRNVLPIVLDLTNPSPSIGWANTERASFRERINCDCIIALALIHHIAISNNTPFEKIAQLFASMSEYLIIEFVPKEDSQVQLLLRNREDIFDEYTVEGFEKCFLNLYDIIEKRNVLDSKRIVYLMKRNKDGSALYQGRIINEN